MVAVYLGCLAHLMLALRSKEGWLWTQMGEGVCTMDSGSLLTDDSATTEWILSDYVLNTVAGGSDTGMMDRWCQGLCEEEGMEICYLELDFSTTYGKCLGTHSRCDWGIGLQAPTGSPHERMWERNLGGAGPGPGPGPGPFTTAFTTAAPSPAPTTSGPPASTAVGDPHCSNSKGEKFDITVLTSRIPMIVLPQNSSIENSDLILFADTTPNVWTDCAPPFFNAFEIRAGDCKLLFSVGSQSPAISQPGDWVAKGCATSVETRGDGHNGVFVTVPSTDITMKIYQIQTLHKKEVFKFLNLEVSGKGLVGAGGILGNDPHDWVSNDGNTLCANDLRIGHEAFGGSYARVL